MQADALPNLVLDLSKGGHGALVTPPKNMVVMEIPSIMQSLRRG